MTTLTTRSRIELALISVYVTSTLQHFLLINILLSHYLVQWQNYKLVFE